MPITPGPWEWKNLNEEKYHIEAEGLCGENGEIIIDIEDDFPGYPECGRHLIVSMSKDDARAIVCAPEMVEALESLKIPSNETLDIMDNDKKEGTRLINLVCKIKDLRKARAVLRRAYMEDL